MATNEELIADFKDEKIAAKMYLELVNDAMTELDLTYLQNELNHISATYINMGKILREIEALPDSAITADDIDDLKAEHKYVEVSLQKCKAAWQRQQEQIQDTIPITEARAWFSYVLRWASANGVSALKEESV